MLGALLQHGFVHEEGTGPVAKEQNTKRKSEDTVRCAGASDAKRNPQNNKLRKESNGVQAQERRVAESGNELWRLTADNERVCHGVVHVADQLTGGPSQDERREGKALSGLQANVIRNWYCPERRESTGIPLCTHSRNNVADNNNE